MTARACLALLVVPCLLPATLAVAAAPPRARRDAAPAPRAVAPAASAAPGGANTAPAREQAEFAALPAAAASVAAPHAADPAPAPGAEQALDIDWLAEPAAAPAAQAGRGLASAVLVLVGGAAAAAGGAAWQRRRRSPPVACEQEQIGLLATRALGGKQRLALVQVCGERLLLASCDGELTLLSHLPPGESEAAELALEAPPVQVASDLTTVAVPAPGASVEHPVAAAPTAAVPAPASVAAPSACPSQTQPNFAATLAHRTPPPAPVAALSTPPAAESLSSDLAGLRAWRARGPGTGEVRA